MIILPDKLTHVQQQKLNYQSSWVLLSWSSKISVDFEKVSEKTTEKH